MNSIAAQSLSMESEPAALAKAALGSERGSAAVGVWRGGSSRFAFTPQSAVNPAASDNRQGQPLFEIGSITKVFTGLLLAQAVERGELRLDDTLGKLLNGKANLSPQVAAVTLRQLVTHSSCLPRLPADFAVGSSPANPYQYYGRDRLWTALSALKLENPPPCEAAYSNFGFAVLGELISERYGMSWDALVRERITRPLGMHDTVQYLGDKTARLAAGYAGNETASPWDMRAFAGAGALRSTAADMLIFSRAILAGKTGPLGAAAERLVTPLGKYQLGEIGYAVMIRGPKDRRTILHDGGTGGYRSLWMAALDSNEALIVLASNDKAPVETVAQAIAASRYQVSTEIVAVDAKKLAEYTGVFRIDKSTAFTFVVQDGVLYGRLTGQAFGALTPSAENTFTFPGVGAAFTFAREGGKVSAVTLNQGGGIMSASRTDEPVPREAVLPARALDAYLGHYRKKALLQSDMVFDVRYNAGQLAVKLNDQRRFPVFPVQGKPDRFAYDLVKAELQFERNAAGKVVALVLYQNGEHRAVKLAD